MRLKNRDANRHVIKNLLYSNGFGVERCLGDYTFIHL